jgi:hypothetical protein
LRQIEVAEANVRRAGVTGDLRVRYHGDLARVELASDVLGSWLTAYARTSIDAAVRSAGFERVAIDLRGFRSGSLNVLGGVVAEPLVRARASASVGDAEGLTEALRRFEVDGEVESRARLGVVRCAASQEADKLLDSGLRCAVVEGARGFGFTHVALEIESVRDATVRRD